MRKLKYNASEHGARPAQWTCPGCGKGLGTPATCPKCNPARPVVSAEDRRRAAWAIVARETLAGEE